jgi:hypothetical protein
MVQNGFLKGMLVAAGFDGPTFSVNETGVVLAVQRGEVHGRSVCYVTVLTEQGALVTMSETQTAKIWDALEVTECQEVLDYEVLSSWQVEMDFEDGLFADCFRVARGALAALTLVKRMKMTRFSGGSSV